MKHEESPFLPAAMDSPFDTALRQHFENEAQPDDDGFSQRVLAVLPARAVRRHLRWGEWVARAQWTAISLASCGVAALMPIGVERVDVAQITAVYTLIGLLIFWSMPGRWSRG